MVLGDLGFFGWFKGFLRCFGGFWGFLWGFFGRGGLTVLRILRNVRVNLEKF